MPDDFSLPAARALLASRDGLSSSAIYRDPEAVDCLRAALAEVERLRLDALDTVRIRAEHALLVHFAGQPLVCGQCGAAVMKGYCCTECRADPTEKVR